MNRFRRRRFQQFFQVMGITETTTILDVGGLPYDWVELQYPGSVICVSLSSIREGPWGEGNIIYRKANATALPFPDRAFDIVYSNSLLEHVGWQNQSKVAQEIDRMAERYWVQVPYRNFPVEPLYRALFFYQMPPRLRKLVGTYWTSLVTKNNHYLNEVATIHPPDFQEMRALFPEATILREKIMGLTKSLIAVKK